MTLKLYYHPFSSFCMKVLIALYELDAPFEPVLVDLGEETQRNAFYKLWPIGKFPILFDTERDRLVTESSIVIEYLDVRHGGRLVPREGDLAIETRELDRFFDLYVNAPMQKIVTDNLRPAEHRDPFGVAQARAQLDTALALVDERMRERTWANGADFSLADCAAAPALHYADRIGPIEGPAKAYLDRLCRRASFARVLAEARPYYDMFPA